MMVIPTSVNKLTLEKYSSVQKVELKKVGEDYTELDKATEILSIVSGIPIEKINELPLWKLEFYLKRIGALRSSKPTTLKRKYIIVKGRLYKACKNEKYLNTNQYLCLKTYSTNPDHTSKIAAVIYLPVQLFKKSKFDGEKLSEQAELLSRAKVGQIYGMLFFYSKRSEKLRRELEICSIQAKQEIQKRMEEVNQHLKALGIDTDGITQLIA